MAKLRYLIHTRPSTLPYSLALCTACSLFLGASTPEALAQQSLTPISELPAAPLRSKTAPRPTAKAETGTTKSVLSNGAKKTVARKNAPTTRTTTLSTSSASRVVARRAGSLNAIAPEKRDYSRSTLATLAVENEATRPVLLAANSEATTETATQSAPPSTPEANLPAQSTPAEAESSATPQSTPVNAESVRLAAAVETETVETSSGPATPVTGTFQIPAKVAAPAPAASTTTTATDSATGESTGEAAPSTPAAPGNGEAKPADSRAPRLYAPRIYYDRGTIVAEGDAETPVRLESPEARIIARRVVLDTVGKTVKAEGTVRVEREIRANRYNTFKPPSVDTSEYNRETITETLQGENFEYNFGTREGALGKTRVRLENFNITAEQLIINGQRYIARNVVIRPGGLSDEELKIYGTPPFNLRAKEVIVDRSRPAPPADIAGDTAKSEAETQIEAGPRTEVRSASLYFRNLRLLPIPSALLRRRGGQREEATYQLTPRVYFNSADGVLVTARLEFPLVRPPVTEKKSSSRDLSVNLVADVGASTRVGFRGGFEVEAESRYGDLSVGARINDVVSNQLTDRIELDRLPELQYSAPVFRLFDLPGSRAAGLRFSFVAGDYRENFTNQSRSVKDSRLQAQLRFTTLIGKKEGPYLELFARSARYGDHPENLNTQGFEVGYIGRLGSRLNGQVSFSAQNVDGSTPFRFDRVEIRREVRTTFDVLLTPRWIVPIDLRYDLDRKELRDKTFGLLRNYKTFAYGLQYQSSRRELRLQIRQGF